MVIGVVVAAVVAVVIVAALIGFASADIVVRMGLGVVGIVIRFTFSRVEHTGPFLGGNMGQGSTAVLDKEGLGGEVEDGEL